jgi:hypothetical protein
VTKATFPLLELGTKLRRVRDVLYDGIGFKVLRGLEVDKYDTEDRAILFLGLARHIAEDCGAQDRRGTMMSMFKSEWSVCVHLTSIVEHIMDDHPVESQNDLVCRQCNNMTNCPSLIFD